ncbi:hypothetical protein [Winogradskyella sp.]|uniref:hypothetical protein n=2 Tax=Winogradskyella sp. TaxID=1883156 RepID=UPI003514BC84
MKKIVYTLTFILSISIIACSSDSSDNNSADTCDEAIENTTSAQAEFATAGSDDYTDLCQDYRAALEEQIELCGDEGGSLQAVIDVLGDCSQNDSFALMTANLDGEQYNDMKPNGYNTFNSAIDIVTFSYANDFDYIAIYGNSTYAQIVPDNTTKEIKLFIPENKWQEGTYDLETYPVDDENGNDVVPHFDINFFYGNNVLGYTGDYGGTITITEFDLTNRVITGTFEFQYHKINNSTNEVTGPLDCINGTFNYSLDDNYFD